MEGSDSEVEESDSDAPLPGELDEDSEGGECLRRSRTLLRRNAVGASCMRHAVQSG